MSRTTHRLSMREVSTNLSSRNAATIAIVRVFGALLRSTLVVCHNMGLGTLQGIKGFTVSSLRPSVPTFTLPVGSVNFPSRDTLRTTYRHHSNHLITTPSLFSSFDTMRFSLNIVSTFLK